MRSRRKEESDAAALRRAWVRGFLLRSMWSLVSRMTIAFQRAIEWLPHRFWPGCITSIVWPQKRREPRASRRE